VSETNLAHNSFDFNFSFFFQTTALDKEALDIPKLFKLDKPEEQQTINKQSE
jgi:hypothetical protein